MAGTRKYVDQTIKEVRVKAKIEDYLLDGAGEEDTSDLAD